MKLNIEIKDLLSAIDVPAQWVGIREVYEAHTPRMIRDGVPVANARSSTHGLMVEILVDGQFGYYGTPDMTPEGVSLAAKHAFQQAKIASKNSLYRFDVLFSQTKFIDLKIIENGGWHFTNLKSAEEIEHKLRSYLHHREFDVNPVSINEIKNIIKNKIAIYDLTLDKRTQKIGHGKKLEKYPLDRLPKFLQDNLNKYQEWID